MSAFDGRRTWPTRAIAGAGPPGWLVLEGSASSDAPWAHLGYGAILSEKYDCITCGACCFGRRDYVQVFTHDAELLGAARTAELVAPAVGESPASVGRAPEPQRFMKMTEGRCTALTQQANQFLCAVYEDRPTLCRAFAQGSAACLERRASRGIGQE